MVFLVVWCVFGFRENWEWCDIFLNHTPENAFIYACFRDDLEPVRKFDIPTL